MLRYVKKCFLFVLFKLQNVFWEFKLGIRTRGIVYTETGAENCFYGTIHFSTIMAILRFLNLKPSDVFVDIGCGKGRVVCCAASYKLKKIIGLDIDHELLRTAQDNVSKLKGRKTEIELLLTSADDYHYKEGTVFYLFDPFPGETLRLVLHKLRCSLKNKPRPIKLVYVEPVYKHILQESGFLTEYAVWENGRILGQENQVSFWKSIEEETGGYPYHCQDIARV